MESHWRRNIILFLGTQTISLFGSMLVQYAITWQITLTTQSGAMMTVAIVCGFLPTFFLAPFAGVWADRYNRKAIIILADALIATATLILAVLFLMGYESMWLLFVMSAVRAIGAGIHTPAVGAMIPDIVPGDQLTKVNAAQGTIQASVMLISPMIAGALLTMASIETIFFVDVVTALIAIVALTSFLRVPVHAKALQQQTTSYFADLREGIAYIQGHSYVKAFLLYSACFMFLVAPAAFLTPLQVTRTFGNDVWRLTAIEIAFSLGMIAGGGIMAAWGGFKNRVYTMTMASLVMGGGAFALGVTPIFWLYLTIMGIVGVVMPMYNTPATVLLQEKVDPDFLGRVFGVMGMISSSMMPLGMLVFGPLADRVPIEWLLVGTGVLMFIQGLFLVGSKVLVEAGWPASSEDGITQ